MPATLVSCLLFVPTSGVWTHYTTTTQSREDHTSWVSSDGLVLMGGHHSGMDTEIVPNGGGNFSLLHNSKWACAIADMDSTIITGGHYSSKVVARYNLQGHVENLSELNHGRSAHGCVSFYSDGTMVLIVAGGMDGGYHGLSSTEKMTMGETAWTTIKPLPRTLIAPRIVTLDNSIFLTGGRDGNKNLRSEILAFDGEDWKKVGNLLMARFMHAVTKIDTTDIMGFCN